MIFDVKVDIRIKSCLFIGVYVVDSTRHKVYDIAIKLVSSRIIFKTSSENRLRVVTVDIGHSYLNADTNKNIYTRAGPEFELVGIMADGTFLKVIKALYNLPKSGNRCHANLLHALREIGLNPTCFDPNVCIKGCTGGYEHIGTHTDDVLIIAKEPTSIFDKLKKIYKIKVFGAPKVHIGCNYIKFK